MVTARLDILDLPRHRHAFPQRLRLHLTGYLAAIHPIWIINSLQILHLTRRVEIIRHILFLLNPVFKDFFCLFLVDLKRNQTVRAVFTVQTSRKNHRIVAVTAVRGRRRLLCHNLRAAARAGIENHLRLRLLLALYLFRFRHSPRLRSLL